MEKIRLINVIQNQGDLIMFKKISTIALVTLFALLSLTAHAQESPVGLWKTIDDVSGKVKSFVRITEEDGVLSGTVEKIFRKPEEDQNPLCTKCDGADKGKPIIGLVILTGMKKVGNEYSGGMITDPDNGKHYKCIMTLKDGGKKLNVRGFIGISLFGRTQTWVREQ
jgi:uncharacterized protein (DUF2147 family)